MSAKIFIKTFVFLIAICLLFAACKKGTNTTITPPSTKISGTWRIDSLVSIFRDSTGKIIGTQLYPMQPGFYFYYQFNNDGTWGETLNTSNTPPDVLPTSNGNYIMTSDTSFVLLNPAAKNLNCTITSFSATSFTFNFTYPTFFNGVTPGFIERIFTLKK